jgi:hypothetical protein
MVLAGPEAADLHLVAIGSDPIVKVHHAEAPVGPREKLMEDTVC